MILRSSTVVWVVCWLAGMLPAQESAVPPSYRQHLLLLRADSLMELQAWAEAIELLQQGADEFERSDDHERQAYALNRMAAGHYRHSGDTTPVQATLAQAKRIIDEHLPEDHPELGRYYFVQGYWQRRTSGKVDLAEGNLRKAALIWEQHMPVSAEDLAATYEQLAYLYRGRGDQVLCIDFFERTIAIHEQHLGPNSAVVARLRYSLGSVYRRFGYTFRARDCLEQAEAFYRQNVERFNVRLRNTLIVLGNTYYDADQYEHARDHYQGALAMMDSTTSSPALSTLLQNLGSAVSDLGERELAEGYFEEAIEVLTVGSTNPDVQALAFAYFQMAAHYHRWKNYAESEKLYFKHLELLRQGGVGVSQEFDAWIRLSEVALAQEDHSKAMSYLESAVGAHSMIGLEDFSQGGQEMNESQAHDLYWLIDLKAQALSGLYRKTTKADYLTEAVGCYRYLSRLMDVIRDGPFSDRTKLLLGARFRRTSEQGLECLATDIREDVRGQSVQLALGLMEKTRYSELFRKLSKAQLRSQGAIPDTVFQQEVQLLSRIEAFNFELSTDQTSRHRDKSRKILFDARQELREFKDRFESSYPTYFQIRYDSLLSIKGLQASLKKDDQILEYFLGDSLVSIVSITQHETRLWQIRLTRELIMDLAWMLSRISKAEFSPRDSMETDYETFERASYNLFKTMVQPLLQPEMKNLIISPDEALAFLPFGSLVSNLSGNSFSDAPYLIRDKNIQYTYSSNLLFNRTVDGMVKQPTLLAFSYSGGTSAASSEIGEFPELVHSRSEVRSAAQFVGRNRSEVLEGEHATESAFKSESGKQYTILHLAIHGIGDTLDELQSFLAFPGNRSDLDNTRLYTHEIYGLDLQETRLAVLSACQSGIGRNMRGEGIFSTARAFMYAGVPAIVMSLWNADDRATSTIMRSFHKYLAEGQYVSEALRHAKLEYLSDIQSDYLASPYYWSGFEHLGAAGPLYTPKVLPRFVWWASLPLLLVVYFYWRRNIRIEAGWRK